MKYLVEYKLEWDEDPRYAGPYPSTSIGMEIEDIRGYEGVEYARAVPVPIKGRDE